MIKILKQITFHMEKEHMVKDIIPDIQTVVNKSKVKKGQITFQASRLLCITSTMKHEPVCLEKTLEKIAPKNDYYDHSKRCNDENGYAHIRSTIVGPSQTFVIMEGKLCLEPWQQIIFGDYCPNEHPQWEVYTCVIGE